MPTSTLFPTLRLIPALLLVLAITLTTPAAAQDCASNGAADTDVIARFADTRLFTEGGISKFAVDLALDPQISFDLGGFSMFYNYNNDALDFESVTYSAFIDNNSCYGGLDNNTDDGNTEIGVIINPFGCNPRGGDDGSTLASQTVVATVVYQVVDPAEESMLEFFNTVSNDDAGQSCLTSDEGSDSQVLPVELVAFDAQLDGPDVVLAWQTASETNNAGFEIQRISKNVETRPSASAAWERLAFVEGHGTTLEAQGYGFRMTGLDVGKHTFRLKQIDYDGAFEYSPEVEVTVGVAGAFQMSSVYPNPFNPQTQFTLTVAQAQEVRIEVYNMLGQRVAHLFGGDMEANHTQVFAWDATGHASGLYLIRITGKRFVETQRVTLVK